MFLVLIGYPISNAILMIAAIPILFGLWRDKPWSIPWTFKALSLFCIVVTDSWFAFIVITGLQEHVWISSMLFGAEYLIMTGGLIWYNKFLGIYNNNNDGISSSNNNNHHHGLLDDNNYNIVETTRRKGVEGGGEEEAASDNNNINIKQQKQQQPTNNRPNKKKEKTKKKKKIIISY